MAKCVPFHGWFCLTESISNEKGEEEYVKDLQEKSYLNPQTLLRDGYCYPSASDREIKACGVLEIVEPHTAGKWQS